MKKLILLVLMILLVVPLVSGADWDNVLDYENNDLTVKITNWLGLFGWLGLDDRIGTAELKSHPSVNYVKKVGAGNQVVMWYDFDFLELYGNGLGDIKFTDERTGKTIERDYSFVYWGETERDVYGDGKCVFNVNGTQVCERVVIKTETYFDWLPYNSKDIPKGNIRIGLMTYVEVGDKIDGVWTIAGKKVKKHAVWTASLNVDLVSYWTMDETSGGYMNDSHGSYDALIVGTPTVGVAGKIGTSINFTNTTQRLDPNATATGGNYSFNFWINLRDRGNFNQVPFMTDDSYGVDLDAGSGTIFIRNTGYVEFLPSTTVVNGSWTMYTFVLDTSANNATMYVNGVYTARTTWPGPSLSNLNLGADSTGVQELHGKLDEFGFWNRSLTATEIGVQLWNGGAGITYKGDFDPIVTLNSPANDDNFYIPTIDFNCTANDGINLVNVSLLINGTVEQTNSSGFNNTWYQFTETITTGPGFYNWTCQAYDNSSQLTIADARNFTYSNDLTVSLISPVEAYNSSASSITFNGTASDDTAIINVSLIIDGSYSETNSSGFNATNYLFIKSLSNGNHNWTYEACDVYDCINAIVRNLSIDTTLPVVNITHPQAVVDYHLINTNQTLNWTATDDNLDSCWYNYNFINTTVTCNVNTTNNITLTAQRNITFWANDTFGNYNSDFQEWEYAVFENSQGFINQTLEGVINTFTANVTIEEPNVITIAFFIYNETPTIGSFSQSGNDSILTIDYLAPNVNTGTNLTFFWSLVLSNSQIINLTSYNQTVNVITLDNCSVNTIVLYNYTIVDEANQSLLSNPANTTAELNINLLDATRQNYAFNFSLEYSKINPFAVCINEALLSSTYVVDSVVKYEAIGYSIEYYNLVNSTITNSTIPQNITLYDLFSSDATEFKITFKAEDFTFVENALIYIDRQYIAENNTFKTVELPKTDSNGQTIGHFVRNDVVYNIRVIKDGVVLGNFRNIIAFCQDFTIGDCQMILEATPEDFTIFDYDEQLGIIFQTLPTYNENTSAITFDFSTDDGTSKTVLMEVTRKDIFGNRSICNNTIVSSSGTLSCAFDPNIDDSVLSVDISVDGQPVVFSNVRLESSDYGNLGYVLWFFITFLFILLFGHSKTELLIGISISFIGAIALGVTRGDIIGLGSAGIWVLVIVILGIVKLNKGIPQ